MALPILERMGLLTTAGMGGGVPETVSVGRARLAYHGADSYLGHQEILGIIPPMPAGDLLRSTVEHVSWRLSHAGHRVRVLDGGPALLVDDAVLVGDNLEADPGQALNLLVPTGTVPFAQGVAIGRVVRAGVANSRVIVCGGSSFDAGDYADVLTMTSSGQHGVRTPSIGLYDDSYQVVHLGLPVDATRQLHQRVADAGHPVALFGKVADLASGEVAHRAPIVDTTRVLTAVGGWLAQIDSGLAVATVQETDLAGHEQDPARLAAALVIVDGWLGDHLSSRGRAEIVAVTADHGNDPVAGGGQHTRELAPVLWDEVARPPRAVGVRRSLADVAATLADRFNAPWDSDGTDLFAHGAVADRAGAACSSRPAGDDA